MHGLVAPRSLCFLCGHGTRCLVEWPGLSPCQLTGVTTAGQYWQGFWHFCVFFKAVLCIGFRNSNCGVAVSGFTFYRLPSCSQDNRHLRPAISCVSGCSWHWFGQPVSLDGLSVFPSGKLPLACCDAFSQRLGFRSFGHGLVPERCLLSWVVLSTPTAQLIANWRLSTDSRRWVSSQENSNHTVASVQPIF